jgi:16S rRNA (cytidine1402-2'-O)-methyltransferase
MPSDKKTSPDYPRYARKLLEVAKLHEVTKLHEVSGKDGSCKLPPGLYVVATPIGNRGDISLRALLTLAAVDRICCEDTRTSGALFTAYGIKKPLLSYTEHNDRKRTPEIMARIAKGEAVALVSDAGLPLIADPGQRLVEACRGEGFAVTVIPGANAALAALAGSGLPTTQFHFAGFLPSKSSQRLKALAALKTSLATLLFYESPQRLADMLADLAQTMGRDRVGAVARELTKLHEETRQGSLAELAAYYKAHPAKGEVVVLVAPPASIDVASIDDIDELLKEHMRNKSLRDAVTIVTGLTGAKKSEVYARALWAARGAAGMKEGK